VNFTSSLLYSNETIFLEKTLVNKIHENNEVSLSDSFVKINPLIYSEFDPKLESEVIYKLISKNFYLIEKIIIMNETYTEENNNDNNNTLLNLNVNNNNMNNSLLNNSLSNNGILNNNNNTCAKNNLNILNRKNINFFSNLKASPKNYLGGSKKSISYFNSAVNSKTSLQYSISKSEENKNFNKSEFDFPDYLHISLINFIKNFCKIFFNRNLSLQYLGVFQMITDVIKLENSSCLIIFIFRFLIETLTKKNNFHEPQKDYLLKQIDSIFEIIISKTFISADFSNRKNSDFIMNNNMNSSIKLSIDNNTISNSLSIGNLILNTDSLMKILNFHLELNFMNPVAYGKLRKIFYNTLTRLLILHYNSKNIYVNCFMETCNYEEDYLNNNLFFQLVDHYVFQIFDNAEKLKILDQMQNSSEILLGLLIDSIGILQKIDTKINYNYFVKNYARNFDCLINFYMMYRKVYILQNVLLKFFYNITKNEYSRISFIGNLGYLTNLIYI